MIRNKASLQGEDEELSTPHSNSKLEDHPLSAVRDWFFNIFAATFYIGGRSSIRPQPEEVPCRGDRDPHITDVGGFIFVIIVIIIIIIYSKNVNSGKIGTLVQNKLKIKRANFEDPVSESRFSTLTSSISIVCVKYTEHTTKFPEFILELETVPS